MLGWIKKGCLREDFDAECGFKRVDYENTSANKIVENIAILVAKYAEVTIRVHFQDSNAFSEVKRKFCHDSHFCFDDYYLRVLLKTRDLGNVGELFLQLNVHEPEYQLIKDEIRNTLNFVYNECKKSLASSKAPQPIIINFNQQKRLPITGGQAFNIEDENPLGKSIDKNTASSVWRKVI